MSKTKLRHASYSIKKLFDRSHLSYMSRANYKDMLNLCVRQLDKSGYQIDHINQLKQKHIRTLVANWKKEDLSNATMKNRLSVLRYACDLMRKRQVVHSNAHYGIGGRNYAGQSNKAIEAIALDKIADPYIRISLELQQQFGLRREESIKFIPAQADKDNHIELQASWTKGGIRRLVPITTAAQRDCLNRAKQFIGSGSLIPQGKTYIQQRNFYDRQTHEAGFYNLHGLRHGYAQRRYFELTHQLTNGNGWHSPKAGGKKQNELNVYERKIDYQARKIISSEMGHSRVDIVRVYC
jgi:site-specific recombinase XerC